MMTTTGVPESGAWKACDMLTGRDARMRNYFLVRGGAARREICQMS